MTVLGMISLALRQLGVLGEAQEPTTAAVQDGFDLFNDYIASVLQQDRLAIYSITRTVFTMTANTALYTVGLGGTVNVARPVSMLMQGADVKFIDTAISPTTEFPLTNLTDDARQAIVQKLITATYPTSWYYNPTYTLASPYASLIFWPVPNVSTLQGVFYAPAAVSEFTAITDVIALPPGYRRFLRTNLALELAPSNNVSPSDDLRRQAAESKALVLATNDRLVDLSVDLALMPRRPNANIYTGQP